jgi:hypothetical protein
MEDPELGIDDSDRGIPLSTLYAIYMNLFINNGL